MEYAVGSVLVGVLLAFLGLYLRGVIRERRGDKAFRDLIESRQNSGEMSICRWFVDSSGDWGRVRTSLQRKAPYHEDSMGDHPKD